MILDAEQKFLPHSVALVAQLRGSIEAIL